MELHKRHSQKDVLDVQMSADSSCEDTIPAARAQIFDESVLRSVLYEKWSLWSGRTPPDNVRKQLIEEIPKEISTSLPDQLYFQVTTLSMSAIGVFSADVIPDQTTVGPYPGDHVTLEEAVGQCWDDAWEATDEEGKMRGVLKNNFDNSSWVAYIQCARHIDEQNLETFQNGGAIYYRTTKDIQKDEELLVWYGFNIPQSFGVPYFFENTSVREESHPIQGNLSAIINHESFEAKNTEQKPERRRLASCVVCRRGFNSKSNLRSHMRTHTLQKPFECNFCRRRFSQSSTLRNHMRLHTGERPYKCYTCHSAYSQLAGLRAHQKSSQHRPKFTANEMK